MNNNSIDKFNALRLECHEPAAQLVMNDLCTEQGWAYCNYFIYHSTEWHDMILNRYTDSMIQYKLKSGGICVVVCGYLATPSYSGCRSGNMRFSESAIRYLGVSGLYDYEMTGSRSHYAAKTVSRRWP